MKREGKPEDEGEPSVYDAHVTHENKKERKDRVGRV